MFVSSLSLFEMFTIIPQEESWTTNANAFVAHEDDDAQAYGVRAAGFELLYVRIGLSAYNESLKASADHSEPLACKNLCYLPNSHSTGYCNITESTRKWVDCLVSNRLSTLPNLFLKKLSTGGNHLKHP